MFRLLIYDYHYDKGILLNQKKINKVKYIEK